MELIPGYAKGFDKMVNRNLKAARVPSRMMSDQMAARVAQISAQKAWSKRDLETIFFMQGYGRKSVAKVLSLAESV
jgi:hypothetical protein